MTDFILLLMGVIVVFGLWAMVIFMSAACIERAIGAYYRISDRLLARRASRRKPFCIIDDVNYVGDIAG